MWGQLWGQMNWGSAAAVPAVGLWAILLLGIVLGVIAVRMRARKVGIWTALLAFLLPFSALAAVPYIFAPGTVADAGQVNANFAAVIPIVGQSPLSIPIPGPATATGFAPSFVAPRDMACVVTLNLYEVGQASNPLAQFWAAKREGTGVGAVVTLGPDSRRLSAGIPSLGGLPENVSQGTVTNVFDVTAGTTVAFGSQIASFTGPLISVSSVVWVCHIK